MHSGLLLHSILIHLVFSADARIENRRVVWQTMVLRMRLLFSGFLKRVLGSRTGLRSSERLRKVRQQRDNERKEARRFGGARNTALNKGGHRSKNGRIGRDVYCVMHDGRTVAFPA